MPTATKILAAATLSAVVACTITALTTGAQAWAWSWTAVLIAVTVGVVVADRRRH